MFSIGSSISEMNPELDVEDDDCSSMWPNDDAVGVDTSDSDAPHHEPVRVSFEGPVVDTSPWELLSLD